MSIKNDIKNLKEFSQQINETLQIQHKTLSDNKTVKYLKKTKNVLQNILQNCFKLKKQHFTRHQARLENSYNKLFK